MDKDHFVRCLARYPGCRPCLEALCAAWSRYKRLPHRIVLKKNCDAIPVELSHCFGPASLHLSRSNVVSLIPDRLLENDSEQRRIEWIAAIHAACGIPFEPLSAPKEKAPYTVLAQRWRLLFPDLAPLVAHFRYDDLAPDAAREGRIPREWIQAAQIVRFLRENRESLTLSDLGGRFCGDSKALRTGKTIGMIADWLAVLDYGIDAPPFPADSRARRQFRTDILNRHGVTANRGSSTVTLFGPLSYTKDGIEFTHVRDAWSCGEASVLTLENLDRITGFDMGKNRGIITCENESPFYNLVRQRCRTLLLYTKGFPNGAVQTLYRLLAGAFPDATRMHWGDTDCAGLQIAAMLHAAAPLSLWRCDTATLRRHTESLLPLGPAERQHARRFLDAHPGFPFHDELLFTIENGWLEQEQYREESPSP